MGLVGQRARQTWLITERACESLGLIRVLEGPPQFEKRDEDVTELDSEIDR
jgi:hypothetical protein